MSFSLPSVTYTVPKLQDICISFIADHYQELPKLENIPGSIQDKLFLILLYSSRIKSTQSKIGAMEVFTNFEKFPLSKILIQFGVDYTVDFLKGLSECTDLICVFESRRESRYDPDRYINFFEKIEREKIKYIEFNKCEPLGEFEEYLIESKIPYSIHDQADVSGEFFLDITGYIIVNGSIEYANNKKFKMIKDVTTIPKRGSGNGVVYRLDFDSPLGYFFDEEKPKGAAIMRIGFEYKIINDMKNKRKTYLISHKIIPTIPFMFMCYSERDKRNVSMNYRHRSDLNFIVEERELVVIGTETNKQQQQLKDNGWLASIELVFNNVTKKESNSMEEKDEGQYQQPLYDSQAPLQSKRGKKFVYNCEIKSIILDISLEFIQDNKY